MNKTPETKQTVASAPDKPRTVNAYVFRTKMCGGGTSYDVYFRKADKPSHPLHNGHIYCTTIINGGVEYFRHPNPNLERHPET